MPSPTNHSCSFYRLDERTQKLIEYRRCSHCKRFEVPNSQIYKWCQECRDKKRISSRRYREIKKARRYVEGVLNSEDVRSSEETQDGCEGVKRKRETAEESENENPSVTKMHKTAEPQKRLFTPTKPLLDTSVNTDTVEPRPHMVENLQVRPVAKSLKTSELPRMSQLIPKKAPMPASSKSSVSSHTAAIPQPIEACTTRIISTFLALEKTKNRECYLPIPTEYQTASHLRDALRSQSHPTNFHGCYSILAVPDINYESRCQLVCAELRATSSLSLSSSPFSSTVSSVSTSSSFLLSCNTLDQPTSSPEHRPMKSTQHVLAKRARLLSDSDYSPINSSYDTPSAHSSTAYTSSPLSDDSLYLDRSSSHSSASSSPASTTFTSAASALAASPSPTALPTDPCYAVVTITVDEDRSHFLGWLGQKITIEVLHV